MEHVTKVLSRLSSVLTKYIGMIIICFSVIAFFWRDGFAWTTNYTSIFLGVAMFGMGLTIHIGDFKVVYQTQRDHYRIYRTIYDYAADRMGTLGPPSSANGYRTWCHPGRMLPRRNCQQCDYLYRRW